MSRRTEKGEKQWSYYGVCVLTCVVCTWRYGAEEQRYFLRYSPTNKELEGFHYKRTYL